MQRDEADQLLKRILALNEVNKEIYNRINAHDQKSLPYKDEITINCIKHFKFYFGKFQFEYGEINVLIPDLSSHFNDINIFNVELPKHKYFDMKPAIDKLELLRLDFDVVTNVYKGWMKAMEDIHVVLGSVEQRILSSLEMEDKIKAYDPFFKKLSEYNKVLTKKKRNAWQTIDDEINIALNPLTLPILFTYFDSIKMDYENLSDSSDEESWKVSSPGYS